MVKPPKCHHGSAVPVVPPVLEAIECTDSATSMSDSGLAEAQARLAACIARAADPKLAKVPDPLDELERWMAEMSMPGTLRHITLGTLRNMPGVNLRAKAIEMWGRVQAAPPARRRGAGRIAERVASFTAPEVADILVRAVKKGKGFAHAYESMKRTFYLARALPHSDYRAEALETLAICAAMRATVGGGGGGGAVPAAASMSNLSGNKRRRGVSTDPVTPPSAVRPAPAVDDVPVAAARSRAAAPAPTARARARTST